ncbi:hypothetical protein GR212_27095 [Rhizobium lusitanum]|uniref:Uncharacterized protein n=1 Tax=Rhizobium lusitanum TaxID=293958 RepID=A0A6L9UB10_9HYPH|nr:hypothetical protein [Rhizobium lusitanum]NEI73225.1 hypothetical protein [Rhizobium lusitanum]
MVPQFTSTRKREPEEANVVFKNPPSTRQTVIIARFNAANGVPREGCLLSMFLSEIPNFFSWHSSEAFSSSNLADEGASSVHKSIYLLLLGNFVFSLDAFVVGGLLPRFFETFAVSLPAVSMAMAVLPQSIAVTNIVR